MTHRPRLAPAMRVLRRSDHSVQIGVGTSDGIVLDQLTEAEHAFVSSLDTHADLPPVIAPPRAADLLSLLDEHGLLGSRHDVTNPESAGRPLPRVAVEGAGSLVPALRSGLTEAGYRIVPATNPRGVAATTAGHARAAAARKLAQRADLAVLVDRGGVPYLTGEPWRQARVPHIPVVFDGPLVTVGPVVEPGGPCLRCLDLARCDRDPSWPLVLAQVAGFDATDAGEPPRSPDEIVARALAVAVAVAAVHDLAVRRRSPRRPSRPHGPTQHATLLAGEPGGVHASTTWRLPGPDVQRHEWHVHPRCPAHTPSGTMVL